MAVQLAALASQRCQPRTSWRPTPVHSPLSAVSVSPAVAVPVTVGSVTTCGGSLGWTATVGDGCTTSDAAEVAVLVPRLSVAVTTTRSVRPTSSAVSAYVGFTAPSTDRQASPAAEQRSHWTAKTSPVPLQTPSSTPRVSPATATPVSVGVTSGAGGTICVPGSAGGSTGGGSAGGGGSGAETRAVASEAADVLPPASVAVTTTRNAKPASSAPTTWV